MIDAPEGTASRPGKLVPVSFRLSPALKEAIEGAAREDRRSVASLVAIAVQDYLDRRKPRRDRRG